MANPDDVTPPKPAVTPLAAEQVQEQNVVDSPPKEESVPLSIPTFDRLDDKTVQQQVLAGKGDENDTAREIWRKVQQPRRYRDSEYRDHLSFYERGLSEIERRITAEHELYNDLGVAQQQLAENIRQERRYGSTPERRSERSECLLKLMNLCHRAFDKSFNDLCRGQIDENISTDHIIPSSQEALVDWFNQLPATEQCFALAVAVLHGAPLHHVTRHAQSLLRLRKRTETRNQDESTGQIIEPQTPDIDSVLRATFTVCRENRNTQCVFWQSDDLRALMDMFLAHEIGGFKLTFADQTFVDIVQKWALERNEECAWRAGRALARQWWKHDREHLLLLADQYGGSNDETRILCAVSFLYGAFSIEQEIQSGDGSLSEGQMRIFKVVRKWVNSDDNHLNTAMRTYAYLGLYYPFPILDELGPLLGFDDKLHPPEKVRIGAMIALITIGVSGHVRQVLDRLAIRSASLTAQLDMKQRGDISRESTPTGRFRIVWLSFVFLIMLSLPSSQPREMYHYTLGEHLPEELEFSDDSGRDILLSLALAKGEVVASQRLRVILTTAMELDTFEGAMELLRIWSKSVIKQHREVQQGFTQFLVGIGHMLARSDEHHARRGSQALSERFQRHLNLWLGPERLQEVALARIVRDTCEALKVEHHESD